jgi:hypothetical protein
MVFGYVKMVHVLTKSIFAIHIEIVQMEVMKKIVGVLYVDQIESVVQRVNVFRNQRLKNVFTFHIFINSDFIFEDV